MSGERSVGGEPDALTAHARFWERLAASLGKDEIS